MEDEGQAASQSAESLEVKSIGRDILIVLSKHDGLNGSEIEQELREYHVEGPSTATIGNYLRTLDEKGMIEREDGEGRGLSNSITEKGKRALERYLSWQNRHV
jgi:DNA-binding PadR family transcriptional regulator